MKLMRLTVSISTLFSAVLLTSLAVTVPLCATGAEFSSRDYAVGHLPIAVVVHDFNADGKVDLAVLNTGSGDVTILLGTAGGTFQAAKNFTVGGANPTSIAVNDFNGDGKLDLAIGLPTAVPFSCTGSAITILLGNGDGTFQPAIQSANVLSNYALVTSGDVNGDGKPDLVVERTQFDSACLPVGGFSIFLGNGDGSFQPESDISSNPLDVNGDGITDIADTHGYAGPLNIFVGQGNGQYQPLQTGPEGNAALFTVGDFNKDLKQDQATSTFVCTGFFCPSHGVSYVGIALGNGDGTFQPQNLFPPAGYAYPAIIADVSPGDFNGDGKLDTAFIVGGTAGFSILLGKGDGTLPTLLSFDTGSGAGAFVVADFNADNKPDIVATNLNDDTVSVALNTFPSSGADLAVLLSASPEPVSTTQNLTYVLTLQNFGPQDATNVVLTDTLPAGVNFGSVNINQGSCTEAKLVVVCNITKLVSGDSAIATIIVTPTATGIISNSAIAKATETDSNGANNTAAHSTQVDPLFTLTVNKLGGGTGTVAGGGINCGSVCTVSLPTGTFVNLQATPDSGLGFGGWGGACSQNFNAPGCDLIMNANQTVTAEFDVLPNFAFLASSPSLSVQAGQSVTDSLSFYPESNSFPNAIALTCTVQGSPTAAAPTCSISPSSVTLPSSSGATATLTVITTAPSAVVWPVRLLFYALSLFFGGVVLIPFRTRKTKRNCLGLAQVVAMCSVLVSAIVFQLACGGGSSTVTRSTGGTPSGTYTIMITGTSGAIQHSTTVVLTVQ